MSKFKFKNLDRKREFASWKMQKSLQKYKQIILNMQSVKEDVRINTLQYIGR